MPRLEDDRCDDDAGDVGARQESPLNKSRAHDPFYKRGICIIDIITRYFPEKFHIASQNKNWLCAIYIVVKIDVKFI